MESKKNDFVDNKLRWDLLPLELIEKVVEVYHMGCQKYGENTWQNLPNGENRYRAALMRHMTAHCKGETKDPESGLLHLQHVAWNALAMLHFALKKEEANKEFMETAKRNEQWKQSQSQSSPL